MPSKWRLPECTAIAASLHCLHGCATHSQQTICLDIFCRTQDQYLYDVTVGRIVPPEVMAWFKNVRLALPDAEAEWWRNAAPTAAGGTGLPLSSSGWTGPALSDPDTPLNAWVYGAFPPTASPSSRAADPVRPPEWEAGPVRMRMGWRGLRACDYCWIVPLSRVLEAAAVQQVGAAAGSTSSGNVLVAQPPPPPPLVLRGTWPLADALGSDVAPKVRVHV